VVATTGSYFKQFAVIQRKCNCSLGCVSIRSACKCFLEWQSSDRQPCFASEPVFLIFSRSCFTGAADV